MFSDWKSHSINAGLVHPWFLHGAEQRMLSPEANLCSISYSFSTKYANISILMVIWNGLCEQLSRMLCPEYVPLTAGITEF